MKLFQYKATKVWISESEIHVMLQDGRKASLPISIFPLLKNATDSERKQVEIISGYALYWPDLGEDLSVAGFFEKQLTSESGTSHKSIL